LQERKQQQLLELQEAKEEPKRIRFQLLISQERRNEFLNKFTNLGPTDALSTTTVIASEREKVRAAEQLTEKWTKAANEISGIRAELSARILGAKGLEATLAEYTAELSKRVTSLAVAELAWLRLERFIDDIQEIRRRLTARIESLLQTFVMVDTKSTFEELFRRIAQNPLFEVTISESRMRYHQPEVGWRATYDGRSYSGEGVFSQGELNACALSFFIALATTNQQSLGFLLFDDPVQNMDELHIEEFGQVLKFLKDRLGRQLVIALHDESVFSYFKRQLYPSREGQSMVSYVLEHTDRGSIITKDQVFKFTSDAFSAEVA
jgi:DNA repair exonuclease SbcCD ATPase subunit